MATRQKTGGRKAGTPNKRTTDVMEKLDALNCDPISALARLSLKAEADGDIALAARLYSELAPYIFPRRKAVEVAHKDDWEHLTRAEMQSSYDEQLRKELKRLPDAEKQRLLMEH